MVGRDKIYSQVAHSFQVFFFVRRPGIYFQTAAMRFFYPFGMLVEHLEIIVYAGETFGFGFLGREVSVDLEYLGGSAGGFD